MKFPPVLLTLGFVAAGLFWAAPASAGTVTFLGAGGKYAVADGETAGHVIGEVRARTTEPGASLTYTLVSGEGFSVDAATGALSVGVSPSIAAGVVRRIVVRASDGVASATASFEVLVSPASSFNQGQILREKWDGVGGNKVADLVTSSAYRGPPTSTANVSQLDMYGNIGSSFGVRFTGFLIPPTTGTYTFWVASDDSSEFWLGSGAEQESLGSSPTAWLDGWGGYRNWWVDPTQKSADVTLVKGQIYSFKLLFKEQAGLDHVSVAWRAPGMASPVGGTGTNVIPPENLYSPTAFDWTPPATPKNFTVTRVDDSGVHLAWHETDDASGITKYIVRRDGILFAEAGPGTESVLTLLDPDVTGVHSYSVEAVDAFGNVSSQARLFNVNGAVAYDPLPLAVSSGDATLMTEALPVLDAALSQAESEITARRAFLNEFFAGMTNVKYKPKLYGGQIYKPAADAVDRVVPIFTANICGGVACSNNSRSLAVAGTTSGGTRFAAFGDNPFNAAYGNWPIATVRWLLTGSGSGTPSATTKVGILDSNSYANAAKAAMVAASIGNNSTVVACTVANMATCLAGRDLIMVGGGLPADANAVPFKAAVKAAVDAGVPVLYADDSGYYENASEAAVKGLLGFEYDGFNFFANAETSWTDASAMVEDLISQSDVQGVKTMLNHFKNEDWSIDFSGCGDYDCGGSPSKQSYLNTNFFNGAKDYLRARLTKATTEGRPIFDQPASSERLLKLLVLLGDLYRRDTHYPVTPTKVPAQAFLKALLSDYADYQLRLVNPQQPDLGAFSKQLAPTLQHFDDNITAKTLSADHTEAAGAYALPGETVTLVRKDDGQVPVKVFINTLLPNTTKEFSAYLRPKFLKSTPVELKQNVPVRLTSAYGGPLQISVGAATQAVSVAVQIRNVGHHPVWRSDLDSEAFDAAVAKGDYDWSEVLTPGYQAHIRSDRMQQAIKDESWNLPSKLAKATQRYIFQSAFGLTGQSGPGLTLSAPVRAICQVNGWSCTDPQIHGISPVIHANADQSACDGVCHGNPYDSNWGLIPASWRDSYAVGRNLMRFFANGFGTEPSVDIFPTRAAYMWNRENPEQYRGTQTNNGGNIEPWVQKYTYAVMMAARGKADPITYTHDVIWGSDNGTPDVATPWNMAWWAQRLAFYIQLVQQSRVRTDVKFGNGGWDFWTLMYLLDREVDAAKVSNDTWLAKRDGLGFSNYSQAEVQALDRNDKVVIEASRVSNLDQRPFFDLWGFTYSTKAADQVASYAYKPAAKRFWYFGVAANGVADYFNDALGSVPMDGSVPVLPEVPLNFMWTPNSDNAFPLAKPVTLSVAVGAAGKVAFKADGQVIPGCGAVPTAEHHWPNNYAFDKYATCTWIPRKIGENLLTTTLTPTDNTVASSTSVPVAASIADSPGAPHIEAMNKPTALEGASVTLTGTQFTGITEVAFNGVRAAYAVNSPTSITVTIPTVSPDQSVGRFSVANDSGYTAYSPDDFTVWRPVAQVILDKTSVSLNRGQIAQLNPTVTPDYATDRSVTWSTSDSSVATVDGAGSVNAVGLGSATITATSNDGGKVATAALKVISSPVVPALRVVPSKPVFEVDQGADFKPTATVGPADATEKGVTWRSSDNSIATVDSAGNVSGVAVGNTTLIATAASGVEASVPLRVTLPVLVNDATNSLIGMSSAVEFSGDNGVTWRVFDGTNLPPLNGNRILKLRKAGTTSPVKSVQFTDGTNSGSNPLVGGNPANAFLSDLTPATLTNGWGPMELDSTNGETRRGDGTGLAIKGVTYARGLGAHAVFDAVYALGGRYKTFLADVGPDDENYGSVDFGVEVDGVNRYQSGTLRKADGAKRVTVDVAGANTLRLTVGDVAGNGGDHADWAGAQLVPAVSAVAVTPTAVGLKPGDSNDLAATVTAASGISTGVTWSSSDADIASVSSSGRVSASKAGTATITATSNVGAVTGTALVVVSGPRVTELVLDRSTGALAGSGSTLQLNASVRKEVGADGSLTWTSSNPDAATVDSTGRVVGVATGRTTISAATADGAFRASARITVGSPTLRIRSLALDRSAYRLAPKARLTASAFATPAKSAGRFVRWRSSNTSVVTVDKAGTLTGVSSGTAVITAVASDGTAAASASVTVSERVASVRLDRTNVTLPQGKFAVLAAQALPSTARVRSVTWTSSNPAVVVVDSRGRLTAHGRGTAVVTATSIDGGRKAACLVKVA